MTIKTHFLFFGLLFGLLFSSCGEGFTTSKSGLVYRFNLGEPLDKPYGPYHFMLLHHMLIGPNNDTIENAFLSDTLEEFPYPLEARNELLEALQMLGPGCEIEIKINTDSLKRKIGGSPKVNLLESNKIARFIIKVEKILSAEEYDAYRNQKMLFRIMEENKLIDGYALQHSYGNLPGGAWVLDSLKMIKYRITQANGMPDVSSRQLENSPVQANVNALSFECEVMNIDGRLIANSEMEGRSYRSEKNKMSFEIRALNELPFYLKEGQTGEFLITSDWGYGAKGRIGVPSYAPLRIIIKQVKPVD